jgi:hypothetical protein
VAERSWFIIRVELVGRVDEELHPTPGRDLLVSHGHSLLELAVAIDTGFARWDLGHFHMFRLPGGAEDVLGGWEDGDDTRVRSRRVSGSPDSQRERRSKYVFDLGDEWRHRGEVLADRCANRLLSGIRAAAIRV